MPNPIPHSELTRHLIALRDGCNDLIRMTSGGVNPEGGIIPAPPKTGVNVLPGNMAYDSGFMFGERSQAQAKGVLPQLVQVAGLALKWSTQDFMFYDGLRTLVEQKQHVANGMSRTLKSYHLPQKDGLAHAMDLVPVNDKGTPVWDWELIYPVVLAVDLAATHLGFADNIVWGGAWDRRLSDFGGSADAYRAEVNAYANRHPGKDFIDGPHFQWMG